MTPQKGNPYLQIRLEPRMHERLKETAGDGGPGKAGGVALFVRRLIYRELKEPSKDLADLLELEKKVLAWEDEPAGLLTEEIEATFKELWELCFAEQDPIRQNLAFQILGRLTAGFAEGGMVKLQQARTCRKAPREKP